MSASRIDRMTAFGGAKAAPQNARVPLGTIGKGVLFFIVPAGFLFGALLGPMAGNEVRGAAIAFGALLIAAAVGRLWLQSQRTVEALQQRLLDEQSYHAFVDSAIEGFFRTTRDGHYLIVNPALANIYGYESPGQLIAELTDIGRSLYVEPGRRAEFQALMAANGKVQDFVSQIRRRDGTIIWIAENARTVRDDDEQFLFYEGTVEDITVQRESEEAIKHALRETQEAARAKAAFLAAMSHELKTPLNAVIGFSDLMRQELYGPVSEPRYRTYIADIHDNGQRLLALINDILDLSRAEGGLIALDEDIVSLADAVDVACSASSDANKEQAKIVIALPPGLPALRADAARLHQMLGHLISNAVKFTPPMGRISIAASIADDGALVLSVADTGIGMAPERIRHALEPFKQLDSRLARRFEGAGVGLPLVRALAGLHGARLGIASALGQGTTVTLRFPAERTIVKRLAVA